MTYIGKLGNLNLTHIGKLGKGDYMTSEEILKAAQDNNIVKEEIGGIEKLVERRGVLYASAAGVLLCTIMILIELLIIKRIDFGKPAVLFLISGISNIYEHKHFCNKKMLALGIIEIIVTIVFLGLYVGALLV